MRIRISTLLIGIICISCNNLPRKVNQYTVNDYTLFDTVHFRMPVPAEYDGSRGGYPVYYIDKRSDSVYIGNRYLSWKRRVPVAERAKINFSDNDLTITVDTSIKTSIELSSLKNGNEAGLIDNNTAYLVEIRSTCDSAVFLGSTFGLYYMYREIKNKKGEWIKIEKTLGEMDLCLTGQPAVTLLPGDMIIAKAVRYSGDQPAFCRLVMKRWKSIVYSNIFVDSIPASLWE